MRVNALLVPMDSGFHRWRMGAGPEHLFESGVLDVLSEHGEWFVERFEPDPETLGPVASALETQRWLAERVAAARNVGAFPLVFAGNCISSVGIVAGLRANGRRSPAVCWFDAHGDFNTPETTDTGFLDGMAVAMLTGRCWTRLAKSVPGFRPVPESQVLLCGTRDLDPEEGRTLKRSEIEILRAGDKAKIASIKLETLRSKSRELYLHVDLDALDVSEGRVNKYSSRGGFSRDGLLELLREIGETFDVKGAAITAYDPKSDTNGRIPPIAREIVETIATSVAIPV
jgi:arginase